MSKKKQETENNGWEEQTGGAIAFVKEEVGTSYEGILTGVEEVDSKFGKSMKYTLQQDDGALISLWGFSALDYLMNNIRKGRYVKMEYAGIKKGVKTKYGIKDIHTARVFTKPIPMEEVTKDDTQGGDDLPF